MSIGENIYSDAVALEKKLWNREDYSEDDITLFSNVMDFVEANKAEFIDYFKGEK